MDNKEKIRLITSLLSDLCQEVTSRREPEYLYTSAFVAAAGALAWGISALRANHCLNIWWPAGFGALFVLVLGWSVIKKIDREHEQYKNVRAEQGRLALILIEELGISSKMLPKGIVNPSPQGGHNYSKNIVSIAGIGTAIYCIILCLV